MYMNLFAKRRVRGPLARSGVGVGVTLAAIGVIGIGNGVAGAAPLLVDDPVPATAPAPGAVSPAAMPCAVTAPGTPSPASGVDMANTFLQKLNSVLNSVLPGIGSIMPSDTGALTAGAAGPTAVLPGAPGAALPGQVPAAPDQNCLSTTAPVGSATPGTVGPGPAGPVGPVAPVPASPAAPTTPGAIM